MSLTDAELTSSDVARRLSEIREQHITEFVRVLTAYDGGREDFAVIISDALNHYGLSQSGLADLFKTTPATISRWSRGGNTSHLARLSAVAKIKEALRQRVEDRPN